MGTPGSNLLSGTTFFMFSGFSNLESHPDTVEDLSAVTGSTTGQLVLSWTAPAAYGSTGTANGYILRMSSMPIVTELDFVNATPQGVSWIPSLPGTLEVHTLSGLPSNTTSYLSIKGSDQAGNTSYVSNSVSAVTLSDPVSGIQIINVTSGSVTLSWTPLGGANAAGYSVQASTVSDFSAVVYSSVSLNSQTGTLTIYGLTHGKQVYLRVGSLNWQEAANYVLAGSTITLPGPAPTSPTVSGLFASSMTVTWGAVGADDGYIAEVSNDPTFATLAASSVTADGSVSQLSVVGLIANATYYVRVGSLYDNATNYAYLPAPLVTFAALPITPVFLTVLSSSMSVTWGTSINSLDTFYEIDLSTDSSFSVTSQMLTSSGSVATLTGLIEDTYYWARIRALGRTGENSDYVVVGSTLTLLIPPTNLYFSQVGTSSATLVWTSQTAPQLEFTVQLAAATGPLSPIVSSVTANLFADFSGLSPNIPYEARVKVMNINTGNTSFWSTIVTTYTWAQMPINLSTTTLTNTMVDLGWDSNSNPAGTLYRVERSTDGIAFALMGAPLTTAYSDTTVSPDTTYHYRVCAVNGSGVPSAYSNVLVVTTLGSRTNPKPPYGFSAERTTAGVVTYQWHNATQRTDGSPLTNLAGYQIYSSADLFKPIALWTLVATVTDPQWTTTAGAGPNYYYVLTVDLAGQTSTLAHILDDTVDLKHYWFANDSASRIVMPEESAMILRLEKNTYKSDLEIRAQEIASEETGRIIKSIRFDVYNVSTGNIVPDIIFDPALVQGLIAYSVQNGQVVQGSPSLGATGKAVLNASSASQLLSLYFYTGTEWVKTTGKVDTTGNTVSFTGARAGHYQIRMATHASGIALSKIYPRIITPNGDSHNDRAIFVFDNPELSSLSGHVYNLAGRKVAELAPGPQLDSTLEWDGKDSSGHVVPAGIYLYQIDVQGSTISGTIVVAR
jgi:hypothetical protein